MIWKLWVLLYPSCFTLFFPLNLAGYSAISVFKTFNNCSTYQFYHLCIPKRLRLASQRFQWRVYHWNCLLGKGFSWTWINLNVSCFQTLLHQLSLLHKLNMTFLTISWCWKHTFYHNWWGYSLLLTCFQHVQIWRNAIQLQNDTIITIFKVKEESWWQ